MGTNIQLSPVVDDKDSDDDEQDSEADEKPTLLIESFEELQEQEKKEMSREIRDIRTTAQYQYEGHSTLGWCSPDRTVRIRSPPLAQAEHPRVLIRDIRTTAQYQYEGHSTLGWCSPDRTVRIMSPPLAQAEHPCASDYARDEGAAASVVPEASN